MCPELGAARLASLQSSAEAHFYCACRDQLADRVVVLHSVAAVRQRRNGARDAEADFVICDPDRGILVVEVKGGGIAFTPATGQWTSVDRRGERHIIKDPFRQATDGKYLVLEQLDRHPRWAATNRTRITLGHAVVLADVADPAPVVGPASPREIVAGRDDLARLDAWVEKALQFWAGGDITGGAPGRAGLAVFEETFCKQIEVRPLLRDVLHDVEGSRIRLTEQQARLLRSLGARRRAAICGGAGTGKTVIAFQRARELAASGLRTLFVCYNRPLADHLKRQIDRPPGLLVTNFHQLCEWRIALARQQSGRDLLDEATQAYPNGDLFELRMPYALALSCELPLEPFDAIIVDEGQDFGSEYWLPLEMLLADERASTFYLFYDPNQAIYQRAETFPDLGDPFLLLANCRNTRWIHDAVYSFYQGEQTDPPEVEGSPLEFIHGDTSERQAVLMHQRIGQLIGAERVSPKDIAILVAGSPKSRYYQTLRGLTLPKGVRWAVEDHEAEDALLVETVARFKGLERMFLFLWGLDDLDAYRDREVLYVGMSRAKSRLALVGSESACRAVSQFKLQSERALTVGNAATS
jgi:hypothetical protein